MILVTFFLTKKLPAFTGSYQSVSATEMPTH